MRIGKLVVVSLPLMVLGLFAIEWIPKNAFADEPIVIGGQTLTAEQKAALNALNTRLAAVKTLAAKIDDSAYKAEVARQIDELNRSRAKIERNFDQAAYEALMHSVISRYQVVALWLKSPAPSPSPVSPRGWTIVKTLSAPEANQAAAADEKFIFAITNTKVAKYDRQTEKLIAVSAGEAKHLNSGFLWQGRLYCAHSNYPQTPERSEIKVLDIESMQLTTFKDFGNYGGSLTWAVRESDHWWCNFALYGDDNAETFLVKFDDEWREVGRWTYPSEVVSQIGKMSLSGGIWRSGSLLVTDHDHPALYELRLPEQGSVLKFVERHLAPFTGQGIATDPLTGGLVGIDRPKRQVVFVNEKPAER
jgi:hypothetical protein